MLIFGAQIKADSPSKSKRSTSIGRTQCPRLARMHWPASHTCNLCSIVFCRIQSLLPRTLSVLLSFTLWTQLNFSPQIYDPELVPPLAACLDLYLRHPHCSHAIVAATVRNPDTLVVFERACGESFRAGSVRASGTRADSKRIQWKGA